MSKINKLITAVVSSGILLAYFTRRSIISTKFSIIIVLCKSIASFDRIDSSKNVDWFSDFNLSSCNKIFSVSLTWLIQGELSWKFLSFESYWKGIFSWVWCWNFTDFDCIVSEEIMNNVFFSFECTEEF